MVRIVCGAEYGSDGIETACRSGARREDPTGLACMLARQLGWELARWVVFSQVNSVRALTICVLKN
ncbi:hypothetical protein PC121_g22957 [Phytophthora cactorum]|nr:hypothetical protein PC121_g22957 [Phytophthora cactorum]KAG3123006.1 hypothetical protein C6341_g26743 [Phytophthora cactorum]